MLKEPLLDKDAPWKKRFSAPVVLYTQLARGAPTHGMAVGNQSGTMQLYAWDVLTGKMRQLTTRPEGVPDWPPLNWTKTGLWKLSIWA